MASDEPIALRALAYEKALPIDRFALVACPAPLIRYAFFGSGNTRFTHCTVN